MRTCESVRTSIWLKHSDTCKFGLASLQLFHPGVKLRAGTLLCSPLFVQSGLQGLLFFHNGPLDCNNLSTSFLRKLVANSLSKIEQGQLVTTVFALSKACLFEEGNDECTSSCALRESRSLASSVACIRAFRADGRCSMSVFCSARG